MQHAVDAGFDGVSLFALGYEDDDVWRAIDTIAAQIAPTASTIAAHSHTGDDVGRTATRPGAGLSGRMAA